MARLKNDKRERFCLEYVQDLNATQAAIRAGYSEKTAKSIGQRLSTFVDVKERLQELKDEQFRKLHMTGDEVLAGIAAIARADLRDLFRADGSLKSPSEWPSSVASAVAGVDVVEMAGGLAVDGEGNPKHVPMYTKKVKSWDKLKAYELLARHKNLFSAEAKTAGAAAGEALAALVGRAQNSGGGVKELVSRG